MAKFQLFLSWFPAFRVRYHYHGWLRFLLSTVECVYFAVQTVLLPPSHVHVASRVVMADRCTSSYATMQLVASVHVF